MKFGIEISLSLTCAS